MRRFMFAFLACAAIGCAQPIVTRTYSIQQRGLTPGSSGPRSFGPALAAGDFGLSISALSAFRLGQETKRTDGAPGDVAADKAGRLLIAIGLNDIAELGFTVEARPGALATTLASDVSAASYKESLLVIPGAEMRVAFGDSETFRGGMLFEFGAVGIPFERETDITTTTRSTNSDGTPKITSSKSRRKIEDNALRVLVRAGPFLTRKLGENTSLTLGGLIANQPTLDGYEAVSESCFGSATPCTGRNEADVGYIHDVAALTPFLSGAWTFHEHLAIAGQIFATFFTGDSLSDSLTGGGELALIVRL